VGHQTRVGWGKRAIFWEVSDGCFKLLLGTCQTADVSNANVSAYYYHTCNGTKPFLDYVGSCIVKKEQLFSVEYEVVVCVCVTVECRRRRATPVNWHSSIIVDGDVNTGCQWSAALRRSVALPTQRCHSTLSPSNSAWVRLYTSDISVFLHTVLSIHLLWTAARFCSEVCLGSSWLILGFSIRECQVSGFLLSFSKKF